MVKTQKTFILQSRQMEAKKMSIENLINLKSGQNIMCLGSSTLCRFMTATKNKSNKIKTRFNMFSV